MTARDSTGPSSTADAPPAIPARPSPAPSGAAVTANQRFKGTSAHWTRAGLVVAVAAHAAAFALVRFDVQPLRAAEERALELVVPPEADLPPPPEEVARPRAPVVGDLEVDPEATIAVPDWDRERRPPPPPRAPTAGGEGPRFIPYDTPPVLRNGAEIGRALEAEYPRDLRAAGIAGRVELWLYVSAEGHVERSEVKTSSGSERLDAVALRVAGAMRFSPARNRDRATAVWVSQWVTFRIR